jgi:hypothetical protein
VTILELPKSTDKTVAEKLPFSVATVTVDNPVPGGPEIGFRVGVGMVVGLAVGLGIGVGRGVGVMVGVGTSVGMGKTGALTWTSDTATLWYLFKKNPIEPLTAMDAIIIGIMGKSLWCTSYYCKVTLVKLLHVERL